MFTRIIVPLDGSRLAEAILPYATRLALRLEADLLLVRIAINIKNGHREHFVDELRMVSEANDYLDRVRNLLTEPNRPWRLAAEKVTASVHLNVHAKQLLGRVSFKEGDLVMMATHTHKGLDQFFHEDLTLEVLRESSQPLITIEPPDLQQLPPLAEVMETSPLFKGVAEGWPHELIVALDGSRQAETVLSPAIRLAAQLKTPVTLLKIVEPWIGAGAVEMGADYAIVHSESEIAQENKYQREQAYCYLLPHRAEVINQGVECSSVVHTGQATQEIVACLTSTYANDNLLVMATHARSETARLFFGSVAEQVLREIQQPVMLVRAALVETAPLTIAEASAVSRTILNQ